MDDGAAKAERQGEITEEFVRLNRNKEQLHDRIGVLLDRLKEILRKPTPLTEQDTPGNVLSSQFAIDLSSVNGTIETDLEIINEILDRLEL